MKTIDINEHFSELDRSVFSSPSTYSGYFGNIQHILTDLLRALQSENTDEPYELEALKRHIQALLQSVEALSHKYAYETEDAMRVDLTNSGFPNYLEIKKIQADADRSSELMAGLQGQEALRRDLLDYLFEKKEHPLHLLRQLGKIRYLNHLGENTFFRDWNEGKLLLVRELEDDRQTRRFMYDWSSYDTVTNRPQIYIMVFDEPRLNGKKRLENTDDKLFREVVQRSSHNSAPLKVVASDIDEGLENVFPKILKRIDLGPFYGRYSKDDHEFTQMLTTLGEGEFLFRYTTEVVFSIGESRTGSFLSKGELRQIFFVDDSNKECMDRMVSRLQHYLLGTHTAIRQLNEQNPQWIRDLAAQPFICKPLNYAEI